MDHWYNIGLIMADMVFKLKQTGLNNFPIEAAIRKIGFLKNFANFTGNHLCCYFFLIKLEALGQQLY